MRYVEAFHCRFQPDVRKEELHELCRVIIPFFNLSFSFCRYWTDPYEQRPVFGDGALHPRLPLPGSPTMDVQAQPGCLSMLQRP